MLATLRLLKCHYNIAFTDAVHGTKMGFPKTSSTETYYCVMSSFAHSAQSENFILTFMGEGKTPESERSLSPCKEGRTLNKSSSL